MRATEAKLIKGVGVEKIVPVLISDSTKRGFQKAFTLGGYPVILPEQNHIFEDSVAIMSDWREVGNDICRAREMYKRDEFDRIFVQKE